MKPLKKYIILFIIFIQLYSVKTSSAQSNYIQKESFTIPWGNSPGDLSLFWKTPPPADYEGLWEFGPEPGAISASGGFVIQDAPDTDTRRLTKYSLDGTFIAQINLNANGLPMAQRMAISADGYVIFDDSETFYLFTPNLVLLYSFNIPYSANLRLINEIWPSINGGFWCLYDTGDPGSDPTEIYIVEINLDGSLGNPSLLFSGTRGEGSIYHYCFVAPNGQPYLDSGIFDRQGYKYLQEWYSEEGETLFKYSPSGELVYQSSINDDPGWEYNAYYYIMWSGDIFAQRASSQGLVTTKYELNLPPSCHLVVMNPPPPEQPAPVSVIFDGSGSTDPNNDTLTFEWDFDGDLCFGEPGDDDYTGSQSNPTHQYWSDYFGVVNMRVSDPYEGVCMSTVTITVDVL